MHVLIAVFDKKAAKYHPPVAFEHVSQAIRSYMSFSRQKPDAMQVQFAEDYDLYDVGQFDEISGRLEVQVPPSFIESMINIVNQSHKEVRNG